MERQGKTSSIPPLKDGKNWILESKDKANLFAKTWQAKIVLPVEVGSSQPSVADGILQDAEFLFRHRNSSPGHSGEGRAS